MYTTFLLYYSSSKFLKFIQGKSPLLQQLASVSLLKEKSKICPKLTETLSWNGPTVHVCCFMLARASTKTLVSRIHIRQPSPKNSEKNLRQPKNSLAGSLVSRGITVYYCAQLLTFHVLCRRDARFEGLKHLDTTSWPHVWVYIFQMIVTIRHVILTALRRRLLLYTCQEQNVRHSIMACSIKNLGFFSEERQAYVP